jgi:hypothetical protein
MFEQFLHINFFWKLKEFLFFKTRIFLNLNFLKKYKNKKLKKKHTWGGPPRSGTWAWRDNACSHVATRSARLFRRFLFDALASGIASMRTPLLPWNPQRAGPLTTNMFFFVPLGFLVSFVDFLGFWFPVYSFLRFCGSFFPSGFLLFFFVSFLFSSFFLEIQKFFKF